MNTISLKLKPSHIRGIPTFFKCLKFPLRSKYLNHSTTSTPVQGTQNMVSPQCTRPSVTTVPFSQITSLSKWAEELNIVTPDKWSWAFKHTFTALYCSNQWESFQKTEHRWYLTPYCLSKFFPGHPSTCWRCCGSNGIMTHILWFCRSISSYWKQRFTLISTISQTTTTPNPLLALVHIGIEKFPPGYEW